MDKKKTVDLKTVDLKADDFVRPVETFTDKLTKNEIKNLLDDYERINDANNLNIGDHVRYFKKENNILKFRMGGTIIKKSGLPDYIVLTNGKKPWSVQINTAIFYRKLSYKKLREEYDDIIAEKDKLIKTLQLQISALQNEKPVTKKGKN
jgi:hypothetical protein